VFCLVSCLLKSSPNPSQTLWAEPVLLSELAFAFNKDFVEYVVGVVASEQLALATTTFAKLLESASF